MIDTKLGKFGIWSLFIVIILTFGLRLFYFGTFFLIKRVDPTIFCRHASDNMYADEITKQLSVDFSLSDISVVKTAGAIIEAKNQKDLLSAHRVCYRDLQNYLEQ